MSSSSLQILQVADPYILPSNFQAENASGCIFSCWVLEHQAPVFAKTMGTDETCITTTYNQ